MAMTEASRTFTWRSDQLLQTTSAILANGVTAYLGACLQDNGAGTNTCELADGTGTCVGFASITLTGDGAAKMSLLLGGTIVLDVSTSGAKIGDLVYASDENTFTLSSNTTIVGRIVEILSSTQAAVSVNLGVL